MKIRLYRKTDKDLITLYKHPSFSLSKAIAKAVHMSATGDYHYIPLPTHHEMTEFPKKIEMEVPLSKEGLAFIKGIPNGSRNDAVKQLVRGYLTGPILYAFNPHAEDGNPYFNDETKKSLSPCPKREHEIKQTHHEYYDKIEKILRDGDQTPEDLLRLLENNIKNAEKEEIQALQEEKRQEDEKPSIVKREATRKEEELTQPPEPVNEEDFSEPETDETFDLFEAMNHLI